MRDRLPRLLLPLLLLALAAPFARAEDEPAAKAPSVFSDQALLEKHLAEACDVVEAIEGRAFEARPSIRISTPEEVAAVLVREFEVMPESFIPKAQRRPLAESISALLMAKYEPARNIVHVVPGAVDLIEKAQPQLETLGLDHLRALLAHEVTHAMDFKRYDIMAMRAKRTDPDAQQALNAIVEGHAQFVAEKAALRWKILPAFERLTRAIVGAPDEAGTDVEKAMRAAALANIRFAYVEGHAFFRAVEKARGAEGVEAALRTPPTRSRMVEEPERWLDPTTAKAARSLKDVALSFAWLAPTKGWISADNRVLAGALESQRPRVPEARRAEWLQGFDDAHLWQAQDPRSGARILVVVAQFDSPENARRFMALDRLIVEHAKPQAGVQFETKALTDGADSQGAVRGFFMHRIAKAMGQTLDIRQLAMAHDDVAIEAIVVNAPQVSREHLDAAVTRAVAWITDPVDAAKQPTPATPAPAAEEPPMEVEEVPEEKPAQPVGPGK